MELTGKVIAIVPEQRFNGRNGEVVRYGFAIETSGQYPKKVAFSVLGEERWRQFNIQLGMEVQVFFDISSREWQGKWFTQADAWRVSAIGAQTAAPQAQPQPSQAQQDAAVPF